MAIGSLNMNVENTMDIKEIKETIGSSEDNTTVMDKLNSLLNNGGSSSGTYVDGHVGMNNKSTSILPFEFQRGSAIVYNDEIHILGSNADSAYYTYHYSHSGSNWSNIETPLKSQVYIKGLSTIYTSDMSFCYTSDDIKIEPTIKPSSDIGLSTFEITTPGVYNIYTDNPFLIK